MLTIIALLVLAAASILGINAFVQMRRLRRDVAVLTSRLNEVAVGLRSNDEQRKDTSGVRPSTPKQPIATEETATEPETEVIIAARTESGAPESPTDEGGDRTPDEPPVLSTGPAIPRGAADLETTVGAKWAVWIGGLALALGGVFLVRYTIEQGLLGPGPRVILGALFSLVLLATGEWTRRRDSAWSVGGFENANIPSILTAAGILAGFATIYAAYGLYGFLSPLWGFVGLTAVTLLSMAAALLHGPLLAALGILASFLVPFLVRTEDPSTTGLASYALAVSISAFGVARLRLWQWMAIITALGLIFWGIVLLLSAEPSSRAVVAIYLVLSWATVCYVFVISLYEAGAREAHTPDLAATLLLSIIMVLNLGIMADHADALTVIMLFVTLAMSYWAVRTWSAVRHIAPVAALVVAVGYAIWAVPFDVIARQAVGADATSGFEIWTLPVEGQQRLSSYAVLGLGLGLLAMAIGTWGTVVSAGRVPLSIGGGFLPILLVALAYTRLKAFQLSATFGVVSLIVSLACFAIARFVRHRLAAETHGREAAVATWLIAALTSFTLGLCMMVERGTLTVALGLVAPLTAGVYLRYPVDALRPVTLLAAGLWIARVIWDPMIVGDPGTTPVFNWLLVGYGIPAAGFAASSFMLGLVRRDRCLDAMEAIAIAATAVTLAVLGLHALDPQGLFLPIDTLAEAAMLVVIGGGMALGLLRLNRIRQSRIVSLAADILGIAGMAGAALGLLSTYNPAWTGEWVGENLFFNVLLFAYLFTGILYGVLAFLSSGTRSDYYSRAAMALSGLLVFTWVSLTIRLWFHPGDLTSGPTGDFELYVYSVAWLIIGIVTLIAGLLADARYLRLLSGIIIVAVVFKVFIIDLSNLQGVLRALSFIVLGVVLVGIGLVYQRLLRSND